MNQNSVIIFFITNPTHIFVIKINKKRMNALIIIIKSMDMIVFWLLTMIKFEIYEQ